VADATPSRAAEATTAIVIYSADPKERERLVALAASIAGARIIGMADNPAALAQLLSETRGALVLSNEPPAEPVTEDIAAPSGNQGLTPRELEVLAAMADGASNKVIARRLGISFHTVKFHVAAILEKLDAESRTEAVLEAARLGLIML
jgi:DNA-binding NarL/FixJ family response regulator